MTDGVSTSGSWPALGEMAQKAKREGERSPPAGVSALSGVEQPPVMAPPSMVGVPVHEKSPVERKGNGNEGVSASELLEIEQQKLAGKKKGEGLSFSGLLSGWGEES